MARRIWSKVTMAKGDPVQTLLTEFVADKHLRKVNLVSPIIKDDDNQPLILPSVKQANMREISEQENTNDWIQTVIKEIIYGHDDPAIAMVQTVSGTMAIRVALEFAKRQWPGTTVLSAAPGKLVEKQMIEDLGYEYISYPYGSFKYLDDSLFLDAISLAPRNSIIIFSTPSQNPVGRSPSPETWNDIRAICARNQHLALFKSAQQGLISGCPDTDAVVIRDFWKEQNHVMVAHDVASMFLMNKHSLATVSIPCGSVIEAENVESNLRNLSKGLTFRTSNFAQDIVKTIWFDEELKKQWKEDLLNVNQTLVKRRNAFVDGLEKNDSPHDWNYLREQNGVFAYTNLTTKFVEDLKKKHHIYFHPIRGVSLGALNSRNVDYITTAIDTCTRQWRRWFGV